MDKSNEYQIIETIATGGMATIYRGVQKSLNREVVIKKLHPHLAEDANFVRRFKREAAILANLQNENIVGIIDFYEKDKSQFIVLEYIKGKTLKQLISEKKRIPYKIALYILKEVLQGLTYIHKNNILHRDLKPDNIMISDDGDIKITDFGLAYRNENLRITNPGTYVGTPSYFPPEQLMGKTLTTASDIFSLGITFAEMLTGKNPFEGKEQFETINNILYHKSIKINFDKKHTIPQDIINLLYSMLQKDPAKRIQDCESILHIMEKLNIDINKRVFLAYLNNKEVSQEDFTIEISIKTKENVFQILILLVLIFLFFAVSLFQIFNFVINKRQKEPLIINPPIVNNSVSLFINSKPKGVDFQINDSIIIKTPQIIDLKKGIYKISLLDSNFESYDTIINLDKNDTLNILVSKKINIVKYGYLIVNVNPWANLYIDNNFYDRTPIKDSIKLEIGKHILRLEHPNRKVYIDTINIVEDSVIKMNIDLQKAYGYLKIVVRPWANVYINDSFYGTTPIADSIKLLIGPHEIRLENPILGKIDDKITIHEKEVIRKVYSY